MKTIIAILAFVLSINASAQDTVSSIGGLITTNTISNDAACEQKLTEHFNTLRDSAIRVSTLDLQQELLKYTLVLKVVVSKERPDAIANTNSVQHFIVVSTSLCNFSEIEQEVVITHEFGHAIIHFEYPEVARDAYGSNTRFTIETHEALANNAAATIFPKAILEMAFKHFDELCLEGDKYQCRRAAAWRVGLGRL